MEFPHLGAHCNVQYCKQLDYLPFECEFCKLKFCAEHKDCKQHRCTKYESRDRRVEPCPECNEMILVLENQHLDEVLARHLYSECQGPNSSKQPPKPKSFPCTLQGCKGKEFVQVICDKCKQNFCLKHRFPTGHKCSHDIKSNNNTSPSLFKTNTTNTTKTTTTKKIESDYLTQQRKQQEELRAVRARQQESYKTNQEASVCEINILLTNGEMLKKKFSKNDTFREIQRYINQFRTDGRGPYAIISETNPAPFSVNDLDCTIGELNLYPSANLVIVVS
ncbi:AN1-type zinc finger-containing protein [Cavenderia fasciculata]|uniref:AN1-type zinc finger-containing protein n=1 Tax=Cavenderia fasciculata TaxID=261658 RepID=F4PM90_CACFS|nr:AN1-type zinc finger-containing protein [Cavenderia fasciculata]EGG23590.1 AN1-type zinc finger-containing protein [Cavenderia fasciculata]|eukprot:XP_004361441.1 AN1-type zinc finger-containing protein [Cavenderia fasciculata]